MSYNVSCGITGLQIKKGNPVRFIILMKGSYNYLNAKSVPLSTLLLPTDLAPVTFPIKGIYNGMNGLDDIEEDIHLSLLTKRYKCSIENLIENTSCPHDLNDSYGMVNGIMKRNVEKLDWEMDSFEEVLEYLGFDKGTQESEYIHEDIPAFRFLLREKAISIFSPKGEELTACWTPSPKSLLSRIKSYAGVDLEPNLKKHLASLSKELFAMTGMYVLEEVYQFMIDPENKLQDLKRDSFNKYYNEFMEEVKEVEGQLGRLKKLFKDGDMKEDVFLEMLPTIQPVSHYKFFSNPISHPFKNWPMFIDLHKKELQSGILVDKLYDESVFFYSMMGTNKCFTATFSNPHGKVKNKIAILAAKTLELAQK